MMEPIESPLGNIYEIDGLHKEIMRLRAALQRIAEPGYGCESFRGYIDYLHEIARAALKEEPK